MENNHIARTADSIAAAHVLLAHRARRTHVGRMPHADARTFRILPLDDVPAAGLRRYRVTFLAQAITLIVLAALIMWGFGAWVAGRIHFGEVGLLPRLVIGWVAFWLALFLLFFAVDLRKALSPNAWLALLTDDGVYVKLRSYQNRVATGSQALFVPFRAIRSAGVVRKTWRTRGQRGATEDRQYECVELTIDRDVSLETLDAALDVERAGEYARKRGSRSRTIWRHYPVSVEPGNVVRIEWRARPSADDFLSHLGVHSRIGERTESTSDLTADPDERTLRELARRGDIIELARAIHARDGGSLASARALAERMIAEG